MALRTRKLLTAAAGGVLTALLIGSLSAAASETDSFTLNRFIITSSGNRTLIGTYSSDSITQAGWYVTDDDALYYYYSDGSCAQNETTLDDGYTYLFSADGALKTGWQTVNGSRYYYNTETGTPVYGWFSYMDQLYYIDENAGKLTGVQYINDTPYTFDEYGCAVTGMNTYEDGSLYYYDENAAVFTGWYNTDDGTYYFGADGAATGFTVIDGASYYFSENGILQYGWISTEAGTMYADTDGVIATGEAAIDGKQYLFNADGIMQTGWVTTDAGQRYYNAKGVMATGLQVIDGKIYYLSEMGYLQTGWQTIGDSKYYFDETTGTLYTGWQTTDDGKVYCTESGLASGLIELDGETYYFLPSTGVMQTGWITVDGTSRYFDEATGVMKDIGHAAVQLDVVDYKQFGESWSNTKITYSTIGQVGCLVTSIAMKYSYQTNTKTTPDKMLSKLTFSGDSLLWNSCTDLGYTVDTVSGSLTQSMMQTIYNQLQNNKPVIIGAKKSNGNQHYVVVTGYKGSTGTSFSTSNFVINDPGSSWRYTLDEYLALFPNMYKIIY